LLIGDCGCLWFGSTGRFALGLVPRNHFVRFPDSMPAVFRNLPMLLLLSHGGGMGGIAVEGLVGSFHDGSSNGVASAFDASEARLDVFCDGRHGDSCECDT
jgi:hypothetical protein